GYAGMTAADLYARAGTSQKNLHRALELLGARGELLLVDKERRLYLSREVLQGMVARALAFLQAFHEREPMREGLPKEELRQRLSTNLEPRTFARVVQGLLEGGKVEAAGEVLRLKGRGRSLTVGDEAQRAQVLSQLAAAGLAPPKVSELAE